MPKSTQILKSATSFGEAVRQLREARGLTLRELASRMGVSAPFLSDVEHDRRNTDKLDELAKALDVDVADIKALDGRLPEDLKAWMSANPTLIGSLDAFRRSGKDIDQLMTSIQSAVEPTRKRGGRSGSASVVGALG